MICIIVTCAIVVGTARRCEPGTVSAYYIDAPAVIRDMEDCRKAFKAAPMDSGRRKVAVDRIPKLTVNQILQGE